MELFKLLFFFFTFPLSNAFLSNNVARGRTSDNCHNATPQQQLGGFERLHLLDCSRRQVRLLNFLGNCPTPLNFLKAWEMQKDFLNGHLDRIKLNERSQFLNDGREEGVDTVMVLEHEPVYTLGTASDLRFIKISNTESDIPVVRMDRGGEVTYHGPGQLTVYLILDLRCYKQDIHWYIRALEESVIVALRSYGLTAKRKEGITGVWIDDFKVAAVGIKCRKWVTMHGIAINVQENSLEHFAGIIPCGLEGHKVGCLNQFINGKLSLSQFSETIQESLEEVFGIRLIDQGLGRKLDTE